MTKHKLSKNIQLEKNYFDSLVERDVTKTYRVNIYMASYPFNRHGMDRPLSYQSPPTRG
jgi:hypothetical protein